MAISAHRKFSLASGLDVAWSRGPAWGRAFLITLGVSLAALGAGAVLGLASNYPVLVWGVFLTAVALPVLWFRPAWAVYGLVLGAATFESFSLNFPDSLTDQIPFFKSYASMGSPVPVPISPAELLLGAGLLVLMLRRIAQRERPLEGGPLVWAIGAFLLTVLLGFVYGIATGGTAWIALWEIRPITYLLPAYLLAFNLVRTDKQIKLVFWLFLGAVALKGLIGTWRYLFTLEADLTRIAALSSHNSLLAHEESLFFALFFTFILVMWLVQGGRNQVGFALLLSPPVLLSFLANQRRTGVLTLLLGTLITGVLVYLLVRHRRKIIGSLAVIGAAVLPVYLMAQGGGGSLLAEPARAIASIYQPGERDLSSNLYRAVETEDLERNIRSSPILGQGYGKPISWHISLPDLSDTFAFWEYIPHNTLLWIWLRAGFLGFVAFWFMMGRFLVEATLAAKTQRDPYLLGVAILAIAATLGWLAMAALDQGLVDFRSITILGTFMGLASRLSAQGASPEADSPPKSTDRISEWAARSGG